MTKAIEGLVEALRYYEDGGPEQVGDGDWQQTFPVELGYKAKEARASYKAALGEKG